ncbi:MAG: FKBP-type peptidyl-prolyl cis-trans isomerase [Bacteroidetes bacterium]|nr:FKBP-type peptidyl-prolyl cis-trans isomerase [Bacteroidota bacterium]
MKKTSILMLLVALIAFSCNSGKYGDFDKSPNELLYKIIDSKEGHKGEIGDYFKVMMSYGTENDSILFDSRQLQEPLMVQLGQPYYKGDITEVFSIMAVGDSADVIVSADSFFIKQTSYRRLPDFIKPGEMLVFHIRVLDLVTKEEMGLLEQEKMKAYEEQKKTLEETEKNNLVEYLKNNNINVKPTESGLYFISKVKGTGKKPKDGSKVRVNYTGKLLNGKVFDTSYPDIAKANDVYYPQREYIPLEFPINRGQVIKGWDEGIMMLNEGGKATLIIPSQLAYGERQAGELITPYSNLVFEVELVEVVD